MKQLELNACEAIANLWMSRFKIISDSTGIEMSVLLSCVNIQIPEIAEKKKPVRKAKPAAAAAEVTGETADEKKAKKVAEALAKKEQKAAEALAKKEQKAAEVLAKKEQKAAEALEKKMKKEAEALEKKEAGGGKKKAPAKKAVKKAESDMPDAPIVDKDPEPGALEKKAKKDAEALAKKEQKAAEALAKKEQKAAEALEKKAKKEAEALEKKAKKEADALEKKEAGGGKKKAPAKKAVKKAEAPEPVQRTNDTKFKANEKVVYTRNSGATVDAIVEYVIEHADRVEYKIQVIDSNEVILSREESIHAYEDDSDNQSEKSAVTVKIPAAVLEEDIQVCVRVKRPNAFLSRSIKDVEEIIINKVACLVTDCDIAYLKSSKKMIGKYDRKSNTIRALSTREYEDLDETSEYDESSDEDECPVLSDMSDDSDSD